MPGLQYRASQWATNSPCAQGALSGASFISAKRQKYLPSLCETQWHTLRNSVTDGYFLASCSRDCLAAIHTSPAPAPGRHQDYGTRNGMVPRRVQGSILKRQLLGDAHDLCHTRQRPSAIYVRHYPTADVTAPAEILSRTTQPSVTTQAASAPRNGPLVSIPSITSPVPSPPPLPRRRAR